MSRRVRPIRDRGGYTLIELLGVLVIFIIVVTALDDPLHLRVEGRARRQQPLPGTAERPPRARPAAPRAPLLERRDERGRISAHGHAGCRDSGCLPAHCPTAVGATTTVDYQTVAKGSGRWELRRVQGGTAIPIADYLVEDDVFTYTAQSTTRQALLHVGLHRQRQPERGMEELAAR